MPEPGEKGLLTSGVFQLRRLVAESRAFQERVGAADEVEAARRVKCWDYEDDPVALQRSRPFAVVWPAERMELAQVAGGARNWLDGGGDFVLILTDIDRYPGDRSESGADFAGWIDEVLDDIRNAAGEDNRMQIRRIAMLQRPLRTATKDEPSAGAYWLTAWLFST